MPKKVASPSRSAVKQNPSSNGTEVLFEKLKECIDTRIRPFIQMDGGDIELLELTPEKVLKVRLHGACVGCGASSMTMEMGVQNLIFQEFPDEDIQILLIND